MKKIVIFLILLLTLVAVMPGCKMSLGIKESTVCIDAARQGVNNNNEIFATYDKAIMEGFESTVKDKLKEAQLIIDNLDSQGKLDAKAAKNAMVHLLKKVQEIETNKHQFVKLYEAATQNGEHTKESLYRANDLLGRAAKTQDKIESIINNVIGKIKGGIKNE